MIRLINDIWTTAEMVESIQIKGIDEIIVPYKPIIWGCKGIFRYFLPTLLYDIFI